MKATTAAHAELFAPLVHAATDRLPSIAPAALHAWEAHLVHRLATASARVLERQLEITRTARAIFRPTEHFPSTDDELRSFIANEPKRALERLITAYPHLGLFHDRLLTNWIATVTEFHGRLERDAAVLPAHFAHNSPLQIESLEPGLSDPHHGGRSVIRLRFHNGATLIYKPRSLAPEAHFATLIDVINQWSPPHPLRAATVLDRENYGWMEDIAASPCRDDAELHTYHWRAGVLFGAVYFAQGVDIHRENLIAAGAHPILIDLETLWHPQDHAGADHPLARTVLRTGFLSAHPTDASGLAALQRRPAGEFTTEITDGFRWLGERLLGDTAINTRFRAWCIDLAQCPRRRVLRPSADYGPLFAALTSPAALHATDPIPLGHESHPPLEPEEIDALRQLDVPYLRQPETHPTRSGTPPELPTLDQYLAQTGHIEHALR